MQDLPQTSPTRLSNLSDAAGKTIGRPLKVRVGHVEDYEQIAALQTRNNFTALTCKEWTALWEGNPACKHLGGQWPIGWVLETHNRQIVGWIGNIHSAFRYRGRSLRAVTAWSWLVEAAHRGHGMLLVNRFLRQSGVDLFICTNVSPVSEPFVKRLGFSRVPRGDWRKSGFWVTNFRGFTQFALRSKHLPRTPVLTYPMSTILFCRQLYHARLRASSHVAKLELCSEFDGRFDDFWEQLHHQNENVLLADRTRATLTWHFRIPRLQQNLWILAVCKGSRLVAYAIFDRQDNPATGLRRVRLVDFQSLMGSEDSIRTTLSWMLKKCREDGIHVLEVNGCWLNRPELPRVTPPFCRTLASWQYYYKAGNTPGLNEVLKDPQVWSPSAFDGDISLF